MGRKTSSTARVKRTAPKRGRRQSRPARHYPDPRAERGVVLLIAGLLPAFVWLGAADVTNLPKWTLVVTGVILVATISGVRALETRRLRIPDTPYLIPAGTFLLALTVVTATSSTPRLSLFGEYNHYSGWIGYVSYVVLSVLIVRLFDRRSAEGLIWALLAGSGFVVAYGMVQLAGFDPLPWQTYGFGEVAATLGNPNVLAGYSGATFPLLLWVIANCVLHPIVRVGALAFAVASTILLWGTGSFQGPVTAAAGAAFFFAVWIYERRELLRRLDRRLTLVGLAGLTTVTMLAAPRVFDAIRTGIEEGMIERRLIWRSAAAMFSDHPIVGTGLDTFGQHFFAYRPVEHAVLYGPTLAEAPHNVVLGMFANGGLLLGLAYLAVVTYTGWVLIRGIGSLEGRQRLLLGALGAVWVGYQTQALVSFDRPPLAALHWIAIGAIFAVAPTPGLPWWPTVERLLQQPRRRHRHRRATAPFAIRVGQVLIVAVAAAVTWYGAVRPLRADIDAASGVVLAREGQATEGLERLESATQLAPYRGTYWLYRAAILERVGMPAQARDAAIRGAEAAPGDVQVALLAAQLAVKTGEMELAARWFEEALRRDPRSPQTWGQVAAFLEANDGQSWAERLSSIAGELRGDGRDGS